jgi:hypothetical protein
VVAGDVILSGSTIYFLLVGEQRFYSFSSYNYPVVETITPGVTGKRGDPEPTFEDRIPGMKLDPAEFHC